MDTTGHNHIKQVKAASGKNVHFPSFVGPRLCTDTYIDHEYMCYMKIEAMLSRRTKETNEREKRRKS